MKQYCNAGQGRHDCAEIKVEDGIISIITDPDDEFVNMSVSLARMVHKALGEAIAALEDIPERGEPGTVTYTVAADDRAREVSR